MSKIRFKKSLYIIGLLSTSCLTACTGGDGTSIGDYRYTSHYSATDEKQPYDGVTYLPVLRYKADTAYRNVAPLESPIGGNNDGKEGIYRSAAAFLAVIPQPPLANISIPDIYRTRFARHVRQVGAQEAYARGLTGEGVRIGVVDSGFTGAGKHLDNKLIGYYNYTNGNSTPDKSSNYSHGDSVAMVIAGNRHDGFSGGIAPDSRLFLAHTHSTDKKTDIENYAKAYKDMYDKGVTIFSHSFSTKSHKLAQSGELNYEASYMASLAKEYVSKGILMVWSAANNSMNHPDDYGALALASPVLRTGGVITVVAVDSNNTLQGYSNKCGPVASTCLAAPSGYFMPRVEGSDAVGSFGGTSSSAPLVAGSAALVSQAFPYLKGYQIGQILLGTATDLGDEGVDTSYGYGLLNVAKAIRGPAKFDWGNFDVSFKGGSVFQNDISGAGGLNKDGIGILRMTGNNTYTGPTRVNDGALVVNGSITSDLFVGKNGIAGGDGKFGNIKSEGIVHAGWPYSGTLTVNGNYINDGGSLSIVLGSNVQVNGQAIINGGLLAVDGVENGYVRNGSEKVLVATNGVSGKFDEIDVRPSHLVNTEATINKNDITFTYETVALTSDGLCNSSNGCNIARLIETTVDKEAVKSETDSPVIRSENELVLMGAKLQQLESADAVSDGLNALAGDFHPSIIQAGFFAGELSMATASDRMHALNLKEGTSTGFWHKAIGGTGGMDSTGALQSLGGIAHKSYDGIGAKGGLSAYDGKANIEYTIGGAVFGFDAPVSQNIIAGVYTSFSFMDVENARSDEGEISSALIGGYLSYRNDKVTINSQAFYGVQDFNTKRSIFGEGATHVADYSGRIYGAKIEVGYDIAKVGNMVVTPYVAGTYIGSRSGSFKEDGLAALSSNKSKSSLFRSEAGVKVGGKRKVGKNGSTLALYGKAAVTHDSGSAKRNMSIDGSEFTTHGAKGARTNVVLGLQTEYDFNDKLSLYGGVDFKIPTNGGKTSKSVNFGLSFKF